jgi:hypothetical protein
MQLARRLYLYFIAAVSLLALAIGLTNLLELLLDQLRNSVGDTAIVAGDQDAARRQLSIYAAVTIVALPIWLLHWWLAERGLDGDDGEDERRSAVRALYLSIALTGACIAGVVAGIRLVQAATLWIVSGNSSRAPGDVEIWLALLLVATGTWIYHGWVRLRDMRTGPMEGGADWLPRLYVYSAAFVGITLLTFAVGDLLALVVEVATSDADVIVGTGLWDGLLASGVSRTLVGAALWIAHWQLSIRLAATSDWRGRHARSSAMRRFYGYAVAFGAVLLTLLLVTRVCEAMLLAAFDASPANAQPFARRLLDPAVRALPFIAAWFYHRNNVLAEADRASEGRRQATVRRVYVYSIALIGLVLTWYGLSSLIALAIDRSSVGGDVVGASGGDPWRAELANLASLTLVGAAAWLWHWATAQRWLRSDPAAERGATVRRAYRFASIAGSIVALLVRLASVIYRVFEQLLGVETAGRLGEVMSDPVAVLVVAVGLLLYHVTLLRADLSERIERGEGATGTFSLLVTGPRDADPDAIAASIQAQLPPGFIVQAVPRSE